MAPQRAAERLAQSVYLAAVARLAMAIGVPVALAGAGWLHSEVNDAQRQLAALPDLTRRVETVERQRERGDQAAERQASRLAGIEAQIAALAATQAATVRTLERIERVLDRRNDRP